MDKNKVNIINGSVVGVFLGKPMQDATPDKPEDNEAYATERNTQTTLPNSNTEENLEKQPEPTGGGVSSWNDLTDKPFDENNVIKPEALPEGYPYKEIKKVAVLEETIIEAEDAGDGVNTLPNVPSLTLKSGVKYTVTYDGDVYECTPNTEQGFRMGNMALYPGMTPDTGEPFLFTCSGTGALGMVFTKTAGSHTVKIEAVDFVVTPMADEYLNYPTMLVTIERYIVDDGNFVYSTKFTQKEIRDAVYAGYTVMGYCFHDGFLTLGDLVNQNELRFSAIKSLSATSWLAVVYAITDDGVTREQASLSVS